MTQKSPTDYRGALFLETLTSWKQMTFPAPEQGRKTVGKDDQMARKPNYGYEKRQKELAKKAKKEEKTKRKQEKQAENSADEESPAEN